MHTLRRARGRYQPPALPTSYIIDQHRIVRYVHVGYRRGDDKIETPIASLSE